MAVWLYFRFPLGLRMVEEMLAARGIDVSHETVRRWAERFGRDYANRGWRHESAHCPARVNDTRTDYFAATAASALAPRAT